MAAKSHSPVEEADALTIKDMPLNWLPTEVLAGVLYRVGPATRWQVELVDRRLAAVAFTHAWRHSRRLCIVDNNEDFSDLEYDAWNGRVYVSVASTVAEAVRAIIRRARITHVEIVNFYHGLRGKRQLRLSAMAFLLTESPRVRLRHFHFEHYWCHTPAFCASDELVQLIERHAATLQSVGITFHAPGDLDKQMSAYLYALEQKAAAAYNHAFYEAVAMCAGLHTLNAFVHKKYRSEDLAAVVSGKRLRSLALTGDYDDRAVLDGQIFVDMPSPPTLEELQLEGVQLVLGNLLDTKPEVFANLRRFKAEYCYLGGRALLLPVVRACPKLQVLFTICCDGFCDETSLKALPRTYFALGDDDHTLFANLHVGRLPGLPRLGDEEWVAKLVAWVAAWQADVAGLRVGCFDEAVRAAAALPAPVDAPPECEWSPCTWPISPQSLFVLWLDGGKRRLALKLNH